MSRRPPTFPTASPLRASVVVFGLFVAGIAAGAAVGSAAASRATDPYAGLERFARVLTLIENDYVDPVGDDVLIDAAIRGMVDSLDPHTRWLSPEENRALKQETTGRTEGIGIEVEPVEAGVRITRVLPGSPAERDGLLVDDVLVRIDDRPAAGLDPEAVQALLAGARGSSVVLAVLRDGWTEPHAIRTVRDRIELRSVFVRSFDTDRVYVRLTTFADGAADTIRAQAGELLDGKPPRGLVLDLRDNGGGLLDEGIAVSDLFLDEGRIVSTRLRREGETTHDATNGGFPAQMPVAVLINGGTASASEIVAAALQDTGRAVLVGTHTYGKGTVQTLYENADESALKLTTGRYYTPSGVPVTTRLGRAPEYLVPFPRHDDDPVSGLRASLADLAIDDATRTHLLALLDELPQHDVEQTEIDGTGTDPIEERITSDPQLARAVELVRASR